MGERAESELVGVPDLRFPEGQTGAARQTNGLCATRPCLPHSVDGRAPTLLGGQWEVRPLLCLPGGVTRRVGVQAEGGGAVPSIQGPLASSMAGICSSQTPKHSLYFSLFWLLLLDNVNNLTGSWKSKIKAPTGSGSGEGRPWFTDTCLFCSHMVEREGTLRGRL